MAPSGSRTRPARTTRLTAPTGWTVPARDGCARTTPVRPPPPLLRGPRDNQQTAPSDPDDGRDRSLTLAVLRQLVRHDWRALPGTTLVVLSRDTEGNAYSPFATYSNALYAPTLSDEVGEVYPLPEELEQDRELRELFTDGIPDSAVPALVLYPLG
ncbi:hypothetical protein [Streptomyces sp. HO565]|uniref:hypothetical protein n=1 Tax=Streptomyces sp. HO565 TaxID=2857489 RepID=UPI0034DBA0BB